MARRKGGSERDCMQALIHQHLRRRATLEPPLAASEHLDDDSLAAFTDGGLTEVESAPMIAHLVACAFCRHTAARLIHLAVEMGEMGESVNPAPIVAPEPGRIRRLLDSLAARVLPHSDEMSVFAYHARHEETPEKQDETTNDDQSPERKNTRE